MDTTIYDPIVIEKLWNKKRAEGDHVDYSTYFLNYQETVRDVQTPFVQTGAMVGVGMGVTIATGGVGVGPYLAGAGAVSGMSMALDPKVRHSLATGDWVSAMAHGSYHAPFIGNGRNAWDAWQMGKPWSAAGHAGLFSIEVLGMRSAGKVRGIRVPLTKPARLVRKGGKASTGVAKSGGVKASQKLPSHLQSIIKPDGKLIGKQLGNNPAIHTITASDAEHIIKRLIKSGAKKAEHPRYPGTWYQFPNGKGFGVRVTNSVESLRHGTKNCIDLADLGIDGVEKLKF